MSGNEQREGGAPSGGDGERRLYRTPTCFACNEKGHYANQCPNRSMRNGSSSRPSTLTDSRRSRSPRRYDARRRYMSPRRHSDMHSQIKELSKSLTVMKEHYVREQEKKEAKARKKKEMEEAKRAEEEERVRQERKKAKEEAKQKEAERVAEMRKDLNIHMATKLREMEDNFVERVKQASGPLQAKDKGKKRVTYQSEDDYTSDHSSRGSETSITQEISGRTKKLRLSEKCKRGNDPCVEENPLLEHSPKRTPKRGILKPVQLTSRLTRSKASKKGFQSPIARRRTPVKTPLSGRKKSGIQKVTPGSKMQSTPAMKGALARMGYRDAMLNELKDLDAMKLQKICNDEGIHYDKKIEAIFKIAEHRTHQAFGNEEVDEEAIIKIADSENSGKPADETEEGLE
ncbi:hypothetical protein CBR_g22892 [Chara braunii]|uniref:CCHC-type domain-containing protein n=1 Tax=Chara braunii TaxID=69332 RepID=A0A388L2Z3_CHABU|nr:hypothetical protein CBR_g22892 [Chara braunii]|eukprot:GBG76675.1 hypothetical protein CBR_g22892 [Chara braunii]